MYHYLRQQAQLELERAEARGGLLKPCLELHGERLETHPENNRLQSVQAEQKEDYDLLKWKRQTAS